MFLRGIVYVRSCYRIELYAIEMIIEMIIHNYRTM